MSLGYLALTNLLYEEERNNEHQAFPNHGEFGIVCRDPGSVGRTDTDFGPRPAGRRRRQPISGEGVAYALWSAELLAQAFCDGDPLTYETLWRATYGQELAATSERLRQGADIQVGAYEFLFHFGLMSTIEGFGPRKVL